MFNTFSTQSLTALTLISTVFVQQTLAAYTLADDYTGDRFFSGFNFWSDADPTNGFVKYQSEADAITHNLVGYLRDDQVPGGQANVSSILIGVDYKNKADDAVGRPSVRLEGKKGYDEGLLIADILHMPGESDGSWPALWLLGEGEWPLNGEIDLVEGVNREQHNAVTLHTSPGCSIPADAGTPPFFTGNTTTPNCDINAPDQSKNVGCSIKMNTPAVPPNNYGDALNANGGGIYALEWNAQGITTWFFPRSATLPASLLSPSPQPSEFGIPVARFAGEGCDFKSHFQKLRIIINTTFCGEWAGQVWEAGGSAERTKVEKCVDWVRDNPSEFENAYWEFRSLRVYQDGVPAVPSPTPVARRGVRRQRAPRYLDRPGTKKGAMWKV